MGLAGCDLAFRPLQRLDGFSGGLVFSEGEKRGVVRGEMGWITLQDGTYGRIFFKLIVEKVPYFFAVPAQWMIDVVVD